MADDNGAESTAGDSSPADAAQQLGNEITETFAKLGGGERLAVLGAAIVLGGWLIFDLLIDEYSIGHVGFSLSVLIVGAAFVHHRRTSGSDPVPYGSLLFVAAGILGLIGATDFIEEARNKIFDTDGTTIIGALIYYIGAVMSGVGALQIRGKKI